MDLKRIELKFLKIYENILNLIILIIYVYYNRGLNPDIKEHFNGIPVNW
jgi:hypothetical protein